LLIKKENAMSQIMNKVAVELEDGSVKLFDTKAEAVDFLRRPAQTKALRAFIQDNDDLVNWIIDVQDDLSGAFESAKVRRVTKAEKKALEKALESVKESGDKSFSFLVENAAAIVSSFRWPSVKRGSEEEQKEMIINAVKELTDGDADLATWLVESKDAILEALEAGKVKREVSPKAAEGLARWRAEQAAKKAAEAAE
jgi:transposase-like protein